MYKTSDLDKQFYRVHEVAVILGFSDKTIREYDKSGILKAERTEGNHRHFSRKEIIRFLKERNLIIDDDNIRRDVIYVRVPRNSADLDCQALSVIEKVSHLQNPLIIKETGSVLSKSRPSLEFLISKVCNNEIRNIYIKNKNVLVYQGFDILKLMFSLHGTNIISVESHEEDIFEQLFSLLENPAVIKNDFSEFEKQLDAIVDNIKIQLKNF